jgi:choline kinase
MRAIILAAGRGLRLRGTTELPKCLLSPDGGPALLDRYVTGLDALNIPATIVAGYRADTIRARLAAP